MAKYLDENGLLFFWQQLKTKLAAKVDAVAGKGLSTNDFTNADQTKLAGIEAGAEVNTIESIQVNGQAAAISNRTVNIPVPTAVSGLTNDSGYQTQAQVTSAIAAAIGGIETIKFSIVSELPTVGAGNTIYLLPIAGTDAYDEYIYVNSAWEKIGSTDVDLSNYWNFSNLTAMSNSDIDNILAS